MNKFPTRSSGAGAKAPLMYVNYKACQLRFSRDRYRVLFVRDPLGTVATVIAKTWDDGD